ncbi:MAG: Uma2 family endonuclease [Bacteroidetes bacterium]|nr:MAG: Uma2 family endonuclease [Bacteroidota bacterium]
MDKDSEGFYVVAMDFAIELMSDTDRLAVAQAKMNEYMKNGVRLAWLIQPKKRKTWVYKQDSEVKEQSFDVPLSGQDVLVGFELDLSKIFG